MSTTFTYDGFEIPVDLALMTGGGQETWHDITVGHLLEYEKYCPIRPHDHVLEIGCGVGRDAIGLSKVLGSEGRYVGIDIIRPSIEWCQSHISPRYPNFEFHYLNIRSEIHNPGGDLHVRQVSLPVETRSIDRIILQSVFTHMFEDDIVHYLKEFRRALRSDGRVFASWFLLDDETLQMARAVPDGELTFAFDFGDGCFVNDERYPEGAVGFTPKAFERILRRGGFELDQPVHRGFWCGREGTSDGQDIAVLRAL
jgi:ubiquinone/menaquinone biosynthesis C-methylase UbiE